MATASGGERNVQATLWRNFFGSIEQQKKLLKSLTSGDDLESEYQMIKKAVQSSASKNGRLKKRKSKSPAAVKRSSGTSSEDSDENKRKKKFKRESSGDEEVLNGDDVPLVEEVAEDLLENDSDEAEVETLGVNGENFMNTVMKMNKALGLKKSPKTSKKTMKIDNGLGVVAVDEEELVLSKQKKSKNGESSNETGSVEEGKKTFAWMIQPETVDRFFSENWEKRPLHIKRKNQSGFYKHVFSTKSFDDILKHQNVQFTKNLDVTSYSEGQRETHNPEGRAYAPVVWDFYNNGCSLRMLNPQTFDDSVWKLCATLQDYLGSFVGTNMYLTPPGTQGFAPHYDDVEVFILQLEGKKRWRLYQPRCAQETLPRFSSPNFRQDEIGEPMLDVILEAGDLLYMPRGTIHQGNCLKDAHSLHITVSCHQLNTMGDFLEKLLPSALKVAMEEDVEFRQGLPIDYMQFLGVAHSQGSVIEAKRQAFAAKVQKLMGKLFDYAPLDSAADEMGKKFMHVSLPPFLTNNESNRCVQTGGERWNVTKGRVVNRVEIDPDTQIRLIRAHCLRLVEESDVIRIYFNVENTREYEEVEPQFLELDAETAPAIEALIEKYPRFVKVESLPIEQLDLKMKVVQDLWEKKLLLTKSPLEAHYDD